MSTKHFAGGKITSSHTTVMNGGESIIATLKKMEAVKKLVLGPMGFSKKSPSRRKVKFRPITGGLEMKLFINKSNQLIYIYTSDPLTVQQEVEKLLA